MLLGRHTELAALAGLLDGAAVQRGGTLVVRGAAGVGKSALVGAAVAEAARRGLRVLATTAFQAEIHVPYAGLHDLLGSPSVVDSEAPHGVARAVLDLFTAGDSPLLVVVEDAQWLDRPSWDALTFAGRRLGSDAVAVLMAMRDGPETDQRLTVAALPELAVEPLAEAPARALLDRIAPGLAPALRDQVLGDAGGNPLGLIEFGGAAARFGAAALAPSWLPLTTRVEHTFTALVAELPAATRTLLQVAALDDGDDLAEILAATSLVLDGSTDADVAAAARAGLVTTQDGRLRFRHPLLRSALRQAATTAQRVQVHAALARVTAGEPDRWVWHQAAATLGTDEHLARELTAAADRATLRGALDTAVAALERAAQLSEDPAERASRLMTALNRVTARGDHETTMRLLRLIDEEHLRGPERARLAWFREGYLGGGWSGPARMKGFAAAVEAMREQGYTELAFDTLQALTVRFYWSNPDDEIRGIFLATAERLDVAPDDPRLISMLSSVAPVERGVAVLERLTAARDQTGHVPYGLYLLGLAATAIGAFDLAGDFLVPSIEGLRKSGNLGLLAQALMSHAWSAAQTGDTRVGLVAAAECRALALETGQPRWALTADLARGQAEALRGNGDVARELADAGEAVILPLGAHPMLAMVQLVRGIAALAEGRHTDAYEQLNRIFDPSELPYHPHVRFHALALLAEAAVHSGHHTELEAVVRELAPVWEVGRSPALGLTLAYARAVLAPGDGLFKTALAADLSRWPFERARLELAYGTWLRRDRRAADCRPLLRAAAATFDALGAAPWAQRARQELSASGETLRRADDRRDRLTPQELQIAQLVAQGLSNREVAERLFVSPRTVTTHLYRIYPKLGIGSRADLARALDAPTD